MGYAFQIYALFVASSTENNEVFAIITQSIVENIDNWNKDMKYLMASEGQFLVAMICKYTDFTSQYCQQLAAIIERVFSNEIRMEAVGLSIASAMFERMSNVPDGLLNSVLMNIFKCMHFYRNNTKKGVIPVAITKCVLVFFSTFIINKGVDALIAACDAIQPGILFMIMKSEGDKIKFCGGPKRDRKYTICAFTNLVCEKLGSFEPVVAQNVIKSIAELCAAG